MSFESIVMSDDWRSGVIVPLYKSEGERTGCKNNSDISLLIVIGKMYAGILINRISRVRGV